MFVFYSVQINLFGAIKIPIKGPHLFSYNTKCWVSHGILHVNYMEMELGSITVINDLYSYIPDTNSDEKAAGHHANRLCAAAVWI